MAQPKNELVPIENDPNSPSMLIKLALEKGTDIAQLEKLMDLQERWQAKRSNKAFLDALSTFQAIVPEIKKNRVAEIPGRDGKTGFKYKFADLAGISSSIKSAMQKCGLSYRWEFEDKGATIKCTCFLSHREGHTATTTMEAGNDTSGAKNAIQSKGSTQTYLQRYTLIGALGLSTAEEDSDGKGSAPGAKKQQPQPAPFKKEVITDENEAEIMKQWKAEVDQRKTRTELHTLYLQNKKAVDGNDKIKTIFKTRQEELPVIKPTMP